MTAAGTGTGGTADGNDLIGSTATDIAGAASVWGAGGDDTIRFDTAATAASIYGGGGADLISLTNVGTVVHHCLVEMVLTPSPWVLLVELWAPS